MPFNRRLGPPLLACALGVASACHPSPPSEPSAKPKVAASAPTPASPDQIVRLRAPADEIAVLDGKIRFSSVVSAPNGVVRGQVQARKAREWKKVVLGIGQFHNWVGYIKMIDVNGRVEINLSDGLVVFADAPKDARLRGVIENLNDVHQPVLISGKLSQSFLDAARLSDDPNVPTCFEGRVSLACCQIDLTNISPL